MKRLPPKPFRPEVEKRIAIVINRTTHHRIDLITVDRYGIVINKLNMPNRLLLKTDRIERQSVIEGPARFVIINPDQIVERRPLSIPVAFGRHGTGAI